MKYDFRGVFLICAILSFAMAGPQIGNMSPGDGQHSDEGKGHGFVCLCPASVHTVYGAETVPEETDLIVQREEEKNQVSPEEEEKSQMRDTQGEKAESYRAEAVMADLNGVYEAVYLGVEHYGEETVNKDTKDSFHYRFYIDGAEYSLKVDNGTKNEEGDYDYPIQNRLKENYGYEVSIENGTILSVTEFPAEDNCYTPCVKGIPGKHTVLNFLKTAMEPAGTALYIYGGGWDWQDAGSAVQARTLGVSPDWVRFFKEQDVNFTFKEKDGKEENADPCSSFYPYGEYNEYYYAGLDCSGFVGWAVYNTLETENGREGYVQSASVMAKRLSEMGFGECTRNIETQDGKYDLHPGDVVSINGHVWISLGTCQDGSIVILHSTPAPSRTGQPGGGVEISAVGESASCEAYLLADRYMSEYYPEWYERYPVLLADPDRYLIFEKEINGRFSWNTKERQGFRDPDGIQKMTAEEALKLIFDVK